MNGGNVGAVEDDVVSATAVIGSNILDNADKPTPVQTGYTLQGWAYDDAGATMVGADDNITANLTVYAVWEADGE